jgi:hypothetical protein
MKLDEVLPAYDVRSQHSINVNATPPHVYAALSTISFGQIPAVRRLTRLRGFSRETSGAAMREELLRGGFIELYDDPQEIVFGLVGQFWRLSGGRLPMASPEQFAAFAQPGFVKAAFNFLLVGLPNNSTQLRTETRVRAYGRSARWKFGVYWSVIEPFSGMLRNSILRQVKRRAESTPPR